MPDLLHSPTSQAWESKEGLLAGACRAQHGLGSGAGPTASLRGEELALSGGPALSDGVLVKRLALLGGLGCVLLLFPLLPLPWPPPPRPPASLFCLCSLSFHSPGWLGLLFAEGKRQAALWSLFWFFPSSPGTAFQLEQEKREALARGSLRTHSPVVEESLLAGLGMAGATSASGPQPERRGMRM